MSQFTPEDVGKWIETNYEDIDDHDFHKYLVSNTASIDWKKFRDWNAANSNNEKYTELLKGFDGWEDDEILPWPNIVDEIVAGTISDQEYKWVMENHDRIDPIEFNEWKDVFSNH